MISDSAAKTDFIINVLNRDVANIYKAQEAIVRQNVYVSGKDLKQKKGKGPMIRRATGALEQSVSNPDYIIQAQGSTFTVAANIVLHMRFLDMRRLGNRMIYNRQLWGILYNNALPDIRFGFGKEIADKVGTRLHEIFDSPSKNSKGKTLPDYHKAKGR